MMKILFINRVMGLWRGGGETFDLSLAGELFNRGHHIEFITAKPKTGTIPHPLNDYKTKYIYTPYFGKFASSLPIKIKGLGKLWHLDNYLWGRAVMTLLGKNDFIHTFDAVWVLNLPYLSADIQKTYGVPTITRFPGPPDSILYNTIRELPAIVVSGDTYSRIKHLNPNCTNLPPAPHNLQVADKEQVKKSIRNELQIRKDETVILSVSRLVKGKNMHLLIKAVKKCIDAGCNLKLIIAGEGEQRPGLERLIRSMNTGDKIILAGHISNDSIYKYYLAADIFALLSSYESFSISTLEAMYYGLPVIAGHGGWLQSLVKHDQTGNLVNPEDIESVMHYLQKYAGNKNLRLAYGVRGKLLVENNYSWAKNAIAVENIFMNQQKPKLKAA